MNTNTQTPAVQKLLKTIASNADESIGANTPTAPRSLQHARVRLAAIAKAAGEVAATLSTAPGDTGEIEAFLVVPGTGHPTEPAGRSVPTVQKPAATTTPSFGEAAMAKHAAARDAIAAEKAARFSDNWGKGRETRVLQLAKEYETLKPGSKERMAFFTEHQNDLWQASKILNR